MKKTNLLLCVALCFCAFVAKAQNVGINNTNPQAALDLNGDLRLRSTILTLPNGLNNDVDLMTVKSSVYMFGGGALAVGGCQITGFTGGVDGRVVTIFNNSVNGAIQLYDANFSVSPSAAANKILTGTGSNAIIYGNGSVTLRYDGAKQKWTVIASNYVDGLAATVGWSTTGNAGTTAANFIGTTDAQPLRFRMKNVPSGLIDSAAGNTAFGYYTLNSITGGQANTAIGNKTLTKNSGGFVNTAIGSDALFNNTIGSDNTATGASALFNNTIGVDNTASGVFSLFYNTIGSQNNAIGVDALGYNTTGSYNNAIGVKSLYTNTTGSNNIAVGNNALLSNTTGYSNIAIGKDALYQNTTRSNLVAIGDSALYNNGLGASILSEGKYNTAIGSKSLFGNTKGGYNTAIGYEAMRDNTTGSYNLAIGSTSLRSNTTGDFNTAIGIASIGDNTYGYDNTAVGWTALQFNNTGYGNTAIGKESMRTNVDGNENVAVGLEALKSNLRGIRNTAIGYRALKNGVGQIVSASNVGANYNTGIGAYSLFDNISGFNNTAIGQLSLYNITTGNGNTAIGSQAGAILGITSLNNTVTIGQYSQTNTDGLALLGNTTTTFCGGYKGWTTYVSDGRFKTNVNEDVAGLDFIKALRPVTYKIDIKKLNQFVYKEKADEYEKGREELITEKANHIETGFIAQEVEAAAKKVGFNFDGVRIPKDPTQTSYGITYSSFVVPLVKAVQEQQVIIENQTKTIDIQKAAIEKLEKAIQVIQLQLGIVSK
jgi:trimeric autotransporter adhesin